MGTAIVIGLLLLATGLSLHARLRSFAFAVWILLAFAAAIVFPEAFQTWGSLNTALLIVPLIQLIMFGMGTTLTLQDFSRALKDPRPVLIGVGVQFAVMPLLGLGLAMLLQLEPQVLAGVVLVGSVSGGVASNLMVYLARGNVALSVTMTACSTLASPVLTPLLMKLLCGAVVPISLVDMMVSILNMIIAPVVAGLLASPVLYSQARWTQRSSVLWSLVAGTLLLAAGAQWGVMPETLPGGLSRVIAAVRPGVVVGSVLLGLTAVGRWAANCCHADSRWMDRLLPLISMGGIWIIVAIITARSRDTLMSAGTTLIIVAALHNSLGYLLGYWSGRLLRLSESDSRTVAFEVGMQNSGMAAGLAMDSLHSAAAALAPAIFGPWMNISGSLLASWWNRRDACNMGRPDEASRQSTTAPGDADGVPESR